MKRNNIPTTQIAVLITSLSVDKNNEHPAFLRSLGTVLYQVIDHYELLGAIICYWHYLCYDLLAHISHVFHLTDVQNEQELFKADIQRFLSQTKLVDFCQTEKMKRVCPPEFSELVVAFEWPDSVNLERVEEFRKDYLENYHFHEYTMILGFVERKEEPFFCFRITWFVPTLMCKILQGTTPAPKTFCYVAYGERWRVGYLVKPVYESCVCPLGKDCFALLQKFKVMSSTKRYVTLSQNFTLTIILATISITNSAHKDQ